MPNHVDVYFLCLAEAKLPAYKKLAAAVGKIYIRHGALRYREYVGSDEDIEGVVQFQSE